MRSPRTQHRVYNLSPLLGDMTGLAPGSVEKKMERGTLEKSFEASVPRKRERRHRKKTRKYMQEDFTKPKLILRINSLDVFFFIMLNF